MLVYLVGRLLSSRAYRMAFPSRQVEKLPETLQSLRLARLRKGKDLEVYLHLEALRYILALNVDLSHVTAPRSKAVGGRRN